MQVEHIAIERRSNGCQCGSLTFSTADRRGVLLWIAQWRRAQRVTVEFVAGEGATQEDIRANHNALVNEIVQTVFEQVSRKALFS